MSTPSSTIELVNENKRGDGTFTIFKHWSKSNNCEMKFSIFLPASSQPSEKLHAIMFLPGIDSNEHDQLELSQFNALANEFKFIVVGVDTGPKVDIPGDKDSPYLGQHASFFINAVKKPWSKHYRMYSYVSKELPDLIEEHFPVHPKFGICGFSMGGHGSLIVALRNPARFVSISLFAPVCNSISNEPLYVVYERLLGEETKDSIWPLYDASEVAKKYGGPLRKILVDQGKDDEKYNAKDGLKLEVLVAIAKEKPNLELIVNFQEGVGHTEEVIQNAWKSHFQHHSEQLSLANS